MRGPGAAPSQRADLTFRLVTVAVAPDRPESAAVLAGRLWALGAVGVEERSDRLVAAFTEASTALAAAVALDAEGIEAVADDEGLDAWRDHAVVVEAGPFVVHPPWLDPPTDGIALVIDPGRAFGSGSHPSTRLALQALTEVVGPGDRVLDVGTGSGVLAVAAARLGATVTAIDVDPAALAATRANAAANGVADRVGLAPGSTPPPGPHDVVLVNVTVDLHEQLAERVGSAVRDARAIVTSGVLVGDQEHRAAGAYGRVLAARFTEGEWAALVLVTA